MSNEAAMMFVPSTPPAPSLHEGVAEGTREDEVETCEVNFVPVEDDYGNDFGVFSGAETEQYDDDVVSYYSDNDPVPVLDEVEDEGDVAAENVGDRYMMNRVVEDLKDGEGNDGDWERFLWNQRITVARFWRTQVDAYEGRIRDLEKKLGSVTDGLKAAKRVVDEETAEVERLRMLYMDKISEGERMRETIADLVSQNCELETKDRVRKRNNKRRFQEVQKELEEERKRRRNVEEELAVTRRRLLTFTRRSVPRKNTRLVRRVDSYEDGTESSVSVERATDSEDNEENRLNKLIKVMNNF